MTDARLFDMIACPFGQQPKYLDTRNISERLLIDSTINLPLEQIPISLYRLIHNLSDFMVTFHIFPKSSRFGSKTDGQNGVSENETQWMQPP